MNKSYYATYFSLRYQERMQKARNILGGKCNRCASNKNLQFHHPESVEKRFNISEWVSYTENIFYEEVMKCELLCRSCHSKETNSNREQHIIHGTITAYTYYHCRCNECRAIAHIYRTNKEQYKIHINGSSQSG